MAQLGTNDARGGHEVGELMLEISGGLMLASPGDDLINHEVDVALQKRFQLSTVILTTGLNALLVELNASDNKT
jgi:hypothetical protein